MSKNLLLLGTRKGLIVYRKGSSGWSFEQSYFHGIPVSMAHVDSRTGTWWACLDHGHWGVKLHRSGDQGKNWEELDPPKFPEGEEIKEGVAASVNYLWSFTEGGPDRPGKIWMGCVPGGLFLSEDDGKSWELNRPLWDQPSRPDNWFGGGFPHPGIHSVLVDPRDSDHLFIGISCAGVFESHDAGKSWKIQNKGLRADFLPDPNAEVGHDPHILVACESKPDYMWQQNHCGIFRTTDGANNWTDVSQKEGPANFGFAAAVDRDNPEMAWVVPAVSDGNRIAIDGALVVCRTDDGGKTWKEFRKGLPQENCYDIVYRHGLDADGSNLVFGTTTGNLFLSENYGESWKTISNYLPMIHTAKLVEG